MKKWNKHKTIKKSNFLRHSYIALIAEEAGFIPNYQIEAIRFFLKRLVKKRAQIFFRIFPNQTISKKPQDVRLGRGVGNLKYWTHYTQKGDILVEMLGNTKNLDYILTAVKFKITVKSIVFNTKFRWIL